MGPSNGQGTAVQPEQATRPGGVLTRYFTSHPAGFWFFFWGEFAERCSYYGMRAILAKYMADQLGLGQDNAGTYMSFFMAACYLLPLLGGYVADNFFGKYWTIVGFSVPYILGHVILGIENYICLVIALTLLAMGSGVIKPNISTLMGLTYDQQRPGQTKLRSDAFAMFYFAINIGATISQYAMPKIRTASGYAVAFLFPAALMVVSFLIFAAGKRFYAREASGRTQKSPEERREQWRVVGRISGLFALVMFFWAIFDQSASTWIFFAEACMNLRIFGLEVDPDQIQAFNGLFILLLLPPITIFWRLLDQRGVKVRATDKMVVGFLLTAGCMGVMALAARLAGQAEGRPGIASGDDMKVVLGGDRPLTIQGKLLAALPGADTIIVKGERKSFVQDGRTTELTKDDVLILSGNGLLKMLADGENKLRVEGTIGKVVLKREKKDTEESGLWRFLVKLWNGAEFEKISIAEGSIPATISGSTSIDDRWFIAPADQVTIWWQVFAYLIITVAEVLISVTGLELAYTAAPKTMTGFVTGCWLVAVGMANLFINAPVTRLYAQMQPTAYFAMLTAMMLVVSVAFVFVARRFNQPRAEEA